MRWRLTAGWSGICGKILTVSRVQCGYFMEWQSVQCYSRIIMNPPFSHGQDIRHILRLFPCCVRGAFWLPSVSTGHASRRSCYRFLTSARSCRAARLLMEGANKRGNFWLTQSFHFFMFSRFFFPKCLNQPI